MIAHGGVGGSDRPSTPTRVVYLGPPGTFTHAAAERAFGAGHELSAVSTIPSVIAEVESGAAELGVVPIENSTEGSVTLTLDCLAEAALSIQRELVLEIEHCLIGLGERIEAHAVVASHPQALAQCRRFVEQRLPRAELLPVASTAAAARAAQSDPTVCAIASRLAAELFALPILASAIQDETPNLTRFVVVGRGETAPTGNDRTSIVFSLPHRRGALLGALSVLERAGINLTRIESRPLAGRPWEYAFFVDFEGHQREPAVARALEELGAVCGSVRVLGSFPRAF